MLKVVQARDAAYTIPETLDKFVPDQ